MEWWNGITDLTFGSGGVLVVPELSEGGYFASRSNGIMDNEDLPPSLINILENLDLKHGCH